MSDRVQATARCSNISLTVTTTVTKTETKTIFLRRKHGRSVGGCCRPFIEMTIPSSVDGTLAPPGGHVVQLFTQYTPYKLSGGQQWTDDVRNEYADIGSFTICL